MIAVCTKWADARPEVDPLTGAVRTDARTSGASDADRAALEWALRLGERWSLPVVVVTAGPPEAEVVVREALAHGATRACRVDLALDRPSEEVAAALAEAVRGASFVLCGDWSVDRGSGSVPAFLAAHLEAGQALGCTTLAAVDGAEPVVRAERRLDGGRREHLRVRAPAVISVEGASARLRRAPLDGVLASRSAPVEVLRPPTSLDAHAAAAVRVRPFRPRPHVLPAPPADLSARERILALTGALTERTPPETLVLGPDEAADRLLAQLRTWGYLP